MSVPLYQSGGGSGGSSLLTPVSLANGGTHADLSATGGASQVLKQVSAGADVTVAQLAFTDISGSITAAQSPALQSTTGVGYFEASQGLPGIPAANQIVFGAINTIYLFQIFIPRKITVNKISAMIGTASNGSVIDFGLYDLSGNLVLNTGGITLGAGTGVISATPAQGAGTVINPGWYMAAQTSNSTVPKLTGALTIVSFNLLNVTTNRQGKSSTASSGGILPAGPIAGCPAPTADVSSFAVDWILLT